jgi:hypothetical protein
MLLLIARPKKSEEFVTAKEIPMGLDMYLTAKQYLSEYNDQDKTISTEIMRHFPELSEQHTIQEVSVRVGYWRKANAIHKWFVENVQEGEDNCNPYPVPRERLQELRDTCERVLAFRELATAQLPPASGFFFGSDEINEWYYRDLEETVKIIDACLALPNDWSIEYQSSW